MKRTPLKLKRTQKHILKPERLVDLSRLKRLHEFPCVLCWRYGEAQESPTEAHHMKHLPDGTVLKNQKAGDNHTIPLCQKKHHWNSVHVGMSLREFERLYGAEPELLMVVDGWLKQSNVLVEPVSEWEFIELCKGWETHE